VPPFAVTGGQNRDELKGNLQTLLSSRLSGEGLLAVESPAAADITVSGSYLVFGKIFSLDAVAKSSTGAVLARAFTQGSSQDELIPAMGKLAKMLADDVAKLNIPASAPSAVLIPSRQASHGAATERARAVPQTPPDIIRAQNQVKPDNSGWVSQRLVGVLNNIALGRVLDGEREIFMTGDRTLRYYLQGKEMRLVAERSFAGDEKVLTVDTADLDGDGVPEIYLTMMKGDTLASQVWRPEKNTLVKVADNLQYFFRGIALRGKEKRIYAQERGINEDYYGDVYELVKSGANFSLKNPIKLPRFGNIFNFNMFTDAQGKSYYILFNPDGYLLVYSQELEQLWKSSDKFGGSETYFSRRTDPTQISLTRYRFLDQRITVTTAGEIIVPENSGFFVVGDSRSYSKSAVVAFNWNGSSLVEDWRTRQSQDYMPDYVFDDAAKMLIVLEVVQKEGIMAKGASVVAIKKVD